MLTWVSIGFGLVGIAACSFTPSGLRANDDATGAEVDAAITIPGPDARGIDATPPPMIDAAGCTVGDVDQDGICDNVDDWHCGPTKPSVTFSQNSGHVTVDDSSVGAFKTPVEEYGRGVNEALFIHFDVSGSDQKIQLGYRNGVRLGCFDSGMQAAGWSTTPVPFNTGSAHMVYEIAFETHGSCNDAWTGNGPIIGYLCVR